MWGKGRQREQCLARHRRHATAVLGGLGKISLLFLDKVKEMQVDWGGEGKAVD